MSLPFKVITIEPPQLQEIKSNNLDAPYLYTLKRIPLLQLTRVLDQLAELSTFSNQLFADLGNKTIQLQSRFKNIEQRLGNITSNLETGFEKIRMGGNESVSRQRETFESSVGFKNNLFTTASRPFFVQDAYSNLPEAPPLHLLDEFRTDQQQSFKLFSYPEYFVEEWMSFMGKTNEKKKKRDSHQANNTGEVFISVKQKTARERKVQAAPISVDTGKAFASSNQGPAISSPIRAVVAPPPPPPAPAAPPPPPPGLLNPPALKSVAAGGAGGADPNKPSEPQAGDLTGFLSSIRTKGFVLKKAQIESRTDVKKRGEPEGVAAILMRRAAMENSESEGDDEEDSDWE